MDFRALTLQSKMLMFSDAKLLILEDHQMHLRQPPKYEPFNADDPTASGWIKGLLERSDFVAARQVNAAPKAFSIEFKLKIIKK